jgi:hypothetical protein
MRKPLPKSTAERLLVEHCGDRMPDRLSGGSLREHVLPSFTPQAERHDIRANT